MDTTCRGINPSAKWISLFGISIGSWSNCTQYILNRGLIRERFLEKPLHSSWTGDILPVRLGGDRRAKNNKSNLRLLI